ncbi:metallophosphatase family protein [Paenibacillus sp. sptzw28]|uniref:metallophosphoesterase family protein n=1 Tax=Paenibacillus sp. sptzw28 TaxID=715179 RepID=UPI001C6E00E5|nr:metallophosphoesterase family protein [Paenibacillus sp. sptzw28]QYR19630.1 metallophosphatase family protein [Paenibacillus sp. sptzw28]
MKNYAIITDIHGNSPALSAVLNDIRNKDIDHIFCLGDLVGIGPNSNEVIKLLLNQDNISYVKGNHDNAVVAAFYDRQTPEGHEHVRYHHKWLAERMEEEYVRFLDNMPIKIETEEELFIHYHLDQMNNFTPIDQEPTEEKLDQFYKNADYRLVCFGHHHVVHEYITPKAVYFNPGALGCFHKPVARYGIIKLDNHRVEPQLVEVPYNNSAFLKSYRELGVPESDFILKIFHGGQL